MPPPPTSTKYSSRVAEVLWEWSLAGLHDEESGCAATGTRWWCLFRFQPTILDQLPLRRAEGLHPQPDMGEWIVGAILSCDNDGFVDAALYRRGLALEAMWAMVQRENGRTDEQ